VESFDSKIQANRKIARASAGPKTAFGKLRSNRNAGRHGLSISSGAGPEVMELAAKIVESVPEEIRLAPIYNWAHVIAEAQVDTARPLGRARNLPRTFY
jgi:hypothetical protein